MDKRLTKRPNEACWGRSRGVGFRRLRIRAAAVTASSVWLLQEGVDFEASCCHANVCGCECVHV